VISSTAPANDNSLTTGSLTFSNILNQANYNASTIGGSFNTAGGVAGNALANGASLLGGLTGPGGNASGTTSSAVSAGTITVTSDAMTGAISTAGLSRNTTNTNGSIAPIFNLQQIQNNAAVGQAFGQIANQAVGDLLASQNLDENSTEGILLHGAVGAIQGQLSGGNALAGAASGAASAEVATVVDTYLAGQGITKDNPATQAEYNEIQQATSQIAGTAIGAAVGAVGGTGTQSGATTGGQTALSSTTYNYLSHDETKALAAAQAMLKACADSGSCTPDQVSQAQSQVSTLQTLDSQRDDALIQTCAQGNSLSCGQAIVAFNSAASTYQNVSPSDPDYAAGQQQFTKNAAITQIVNTVVSNNETAELGSITNAFGTGAVAGATTAVAAVTAVAGVEAAATVAQACGTSPACYAYFANAAISDVVAASPQLGGTGVVGAALGTALQEAKAAIGGDQVAADTIGLGTSSGTTLAANNATGKAAENVVINDIGAQSGLKVQGQVTLTDGTTRCVADCAITGAANATVNVPSGFVAEDINGNILVDASGNPITSFNLNANGQALVEVKTGGGTLTTNQTVVYKEVQAGNASGTGPETNAANVNMSGNLPPTPVIVLRKQGS
jgi:filamentous hemagglutinin